MTNAEIKKAIIKAGSYAEMARVELDSLQIYVPELDWKIRVAENQLEDAIRLTWDLIDELNSERR